MYTHVHSTSICTLAPTHPSYQCTHIYSPYRVPYRWLHGCTGKSEREELPDTCTHIPFFFFFYPAIALQPTSSYSISTCRLSTRPINTSHTIISRCLTTTVCCWSSPENLLYPCPTITTKHLSAQRTRLKSSRCSLSQGGRLERGRVVACSNVSFYALSQPTH